MSKLIIVDNSEPFTRSACDCDFCKGTHHAVSEWETFVPETLLQKNMKNVVARITARIENEKPIRRSPRLNPIVK